VAVPAEMLEANADRHLERLTALRAHYASKGPPNGVTNAPPPHIIERDDGKYQIGTRCNAPGPFEMRAFAEAVAIKGDA